MSTDGTAQPDDSPPAVRAPLTTVDRDARLLSCIDTELRRYQATNPGGNSVLSTVDLRGLEGLTRSDVLKIRRLLVLELLVSGRPIPEICQRLSISKSVMGGVLHGLLRDDGEVETRYEELRKLSRIRLTRALSVADELMARKRDAESIRAYIAVESEMRKLDGLNKPQKIEVEQTKQIGVTLTVVTSRDQLLSNVPPPQLELDAAAIPLPAEAVADIALAEEGTDGND